MRMAAGHFLLAWTDWITCGSPGRVGNRSPVFRVQAFSAGYGGRCFFQTSDVRRLCVTPICQQAAESPMSKAESSSIILSIFIVSEVYALCGHDDV